MFASSKLKFNDMEYILYIHILIYTSFLHSLLPAALMRDMGARKVFTSGYRQLLSCQGVSLSGPSQVTIDLFGVVWLSTAGGACNDVLGVMEEIKGSVRKLGFAGKNCRCQIKM